jgi:hypothetical protein
MSEILNNIQEAEKTVHTATAEGRKKLPAMLRAASEKHAGEVIFIGIGQTEYTLGKGHMISGNKVRNPSYPWDNGPIDKMYITKNENVSYSIFAKSLSLDGIKAVSKKLAAWGY